jgi:hypothetical protein
MKKEEENKETGLVGEREHCARVVSIIWMGTTDKIGTRIN